jgi:hypothetical protein
VDDGQSRARDRAQRQLCAHSCAQRYAFDGLQAHIAASFGARRSIAAAHSCRSIISSLVTMPMM